MREALVGTPNVSTTTPPDCITWRYHESWLEYAVRYRLVDYLPDDPTDSEVRKRIWYALHRENIEMPYPGYNVFMTEMSAARAASKGERERERRLELLQTVGILAPLDDGARVAVADGLHHTVYGVGEVIMRAGEPGDSLYVLRSRQGRRCGSASTASRRRWPTLGEGDFFGEMSLMTGRAAPRHRGGQNRRRVLRDRSRAVSADPSQQRDVGRGDRQALERT